MNKLNYYYLTTPLYYVNAEPHVGSAYTTMACDCLARFWKLYGKQVCFLTGVDEHGGKIQQTALNKNITPQEHCDNISQEFKNLWQKLDINYNFFSRTSSQEHADFVQTFLAQVINNGDIYEAEYTGLYCLACEDFKTEKELIDNKFCPIHKTPVQEYSEKNYFFKLSKYTEKIKNFLQENPDFILPVYRKNEVSTWIEEGLKDFPISRRAVTWGIPMLGDNSQTIYVWFDALLGYLSPLVKNKKSLEELKNFAGYTHVVGKDILRFHAVYWLAMLMSAGLPLPKKLFAHGFLTKDGQKMGKTTGNIINPFELIDKFGPDAIRFYFLFNIPFGSDGDYSEDSFIEIVNSYLANRLGNLFSRVLKLVEQNININNININNINYNSEIAKESLELCEIVKNSMQTLEIHKALASIFNLIDKLNLKITEQKPWEKFKSQDNNNKQEAENLLLETLESLRIISNLLYCFMPRLSEKMLKIYGLDRQQTWQEIKTWGFLYQQKIINKSEILFSRIQKI